jgi:two-component system KDP operon response regulator KdpE
MNAAAILIIDDEAAIRKLLEITLENSKYKVLTASSGREGLVLAASHQPDLVILDLGLPDESGHHILKKLREWYTSPVIILSVLNDEENIIQALDNGANDYLVKPFRSGELLARIRSALRSSSVSETPSTLKFRNLEIDPVSRTVTKNKTPLKFTATEYALLLLLARNEGKVLTHHFLLKEIWGSSYLDQSQYLRVYIAQLRKKIEDDPNHPQFILTESRIGYRFTAE